MPKPITQRQRDVLNAYEELIVTNDRYEVYPTIRQVGKLIGKTESTVFLHIQKLVTAGLLVKDGRRYKLTK